MIVHSWPAMVLVSHDSTYPWYHMHIPLDGITIICTHPSNDSVLLCNGLRLATNNLSSFFDIFLEQSVIQHCPIMDVYISLLIWMDRGWSQGVESGSGAYLWNVLEACPTSLGTLEVA